MQDIHPEVQMASLVGGDANNLISDKVHESDGKVTPRLHKPVKDDQAHDHEIRGHFEACTKVPPLTGRIRPARGGRFERRFLAARTSRDIAPFPEGSLWLSALSCIYPNPHITTYQPCWKHGTS